MDQMAWQVIQFKIQQLRIILLSMAQYDRKLFLELKQKLDHYQLGSNFMMEDMGIIGKLVTRLQRLQNQSNANKINLNDETQEHTRQFNQVEQALNMEIGRLIKENNNFRREVWEAGEKIEELKMKLVERLDGKLLKEIKDLSAVRVLEEKERREKQLLGELSQLRYKYNELMELIHENPQFERQYIKRLTKFKQHPQLSLQLPPNIANNLQQLYANHADSNEISLLRSKLTVRQEEILRLQILLQQNHNYIHYRHEEQSRRHTQMILREEITKLSNENTQMRRMLQGNKTKVRQAPRKEKQGVDKLKIINEKYDKQYTTNRRQQVSPLNNAGLKYAEGKLQEVQRQREADRNIKERVHTEIENKIKEGREYHKVKKEVQSKNKQNQQIQKQYYQNAQQNNGLKTDRYKSPKIHSKQQSREANINEYTSNTQNKGISIKKPTQPKKPSSISSNNPPKRHQNQQKFKQQKTNSAFEKLLQQKNTRIAYLEQQLKRGIGRSTKIISTNNINNTNNPNNNLIIKNNKNQYININNITANQDNEANPKQNSFIENELAQAAKEREKIAQRLTTLEKQRQYGRPSHQRSAEEQENAKQLAISYQKLQKKLFDTQNILIQTNQQNMELQIRLNEYLLFHKNNPLPIKEIKEEQQQAKEKVNEMSIEELKIQLRYLRKEIKRMKLQADGFYSDRQILLARLKELEFHLQKLTKQMRFFEEQVYIQIKPEIASILSSVKQLQNQSELHNQS